MENREISLVRHGQSAHRWPNRRITASEFRQWIEAYNHSGIAALSTPPADLIATLSQTAVVVCSDLPRSIESASRILPGHKPHVSTLFREAGRPLRSNWNLKLPLSFWDTLSVILWRSGLITEDESFRRARRRAREAAQLLLDFSDANGRVACVGHGTFNALIGRELTILGWRRQNTTSNGYWSRVAYAPLKSKA
jgi:broad specificity phosphatase PhoE